FGLYLVMKNAIAIFLSLTAIWRSNSAQAAIVSSTADSGPGSLRDSIANAMPGETITFAVSGTIALTSGELLINKDLVIVGPGPTNLVVTRSTAGGIPNFRIINIDPSATVLISGLGMNNGVADFGGGINNDGTLTISNCVIFGNSAGGNASGSCGGGIFNGGTLTAIGCAIRRNSVTGSAGTVSCGAGLGNE